MTLEEAVQALDEIPPQSGTYWGEAIIACREAARARLAQPAPASDARELREVSPGVYMTNIRDAAEALFRDLTNGWVITTQNGLIDCIEEHMTALLASRQTSPRCRYDAGGECAIDNDSASIESCRAMWAEERGRLIGERDGAQWAAHMMQDRLERLLAEKQGEVNLCDGCSKWPCGNHAPIGITGVKTTICANRIPSQPPAPESREWDDFCETTRMHCFHKARALLPRKPEQGEP